MKDPKLNPNLIQDGFDQLAHAYHVWTILGAKTLAAPNVSFDEQKQIADKYYDMMIAPAYGHLYKDANDKLYKGSAIPLSKELWEKQAYNEALKYKIEDAYSNNFINALKQGWNSSIAETARAYGKVSDMLGNVYRGALAQWHFESAWLKQQGAVRSGDEAKSYYWLNRMVDTQKQYATDEEQKDKPWNQNAVSRGAHVQEAKHEFWADALPTHGGFFNKAASFVGEQAGVAPIFAAMDLVPVGNLTSQLTANPAGRRALGYLTAGALGTAYGELTKKEDDPLKAVRDAIGFTIFHGLFDVGGLGTKKLIDMYGREDPRFTALKRKQDEYMLAFEGKRRATPVEQYEAFKKEAANNIAVIGLSGQRAVIVDALHHVNEMQSSHMTPEAIRAAEKNMLDTDRARWSPVLAASRYIRSLLGDKKLSEIAPNSPEAEFLSSRLEQLPLDAASELNTHVEGMDKLAETKAPKMLKQPSAKHTLDYYMAQVKQNAMGTMTQEQMEQAASKMYAQDLQKAAEEAEKQLSKKPVEKAQNAAKRRKDTPISSEKAQRALKKHPFIRVRSERTLDRFGQPAARYDVNPDFTVQLGKYQAAAKASSITLVQFFAEMDDHDFMDDLAKHFYPDALRDAEIWFEGVGRYSSKGDPILPAISRPFSGQENPNVLAFMYNYANQMPREFGKELEKRLINTMKVQKYMNGKTPSEDQLSYYAMAMLNHMDNFLGSGRWPHELNIFRSSNENMFKTSKWQRRLLVEKTLQEQKNIKDMFSGDAKAQSFALKTHAALAKLRMHEFDNANIKRNSQELIHAYDDVIADLITKTGTYERWNY